MNMMICRIRLITYPSVLTQIEKCPFLRHGYWTLYTCWLALTDLNHWGLISITTSIEGIFISIHQMRTAQHILSTMTIIKGIKMYKRIRMRWHKWHNRISQLFIYEANVGTSWDGSTNYLPLWYRISRNMFYFLFGDYINSYLMSIYSDSSGCFEISKIIVRILVKLTGTKTQHNATKRQHEHNSLDEACGIGYVFKISGIISAASVFYLFISLVNAEPRMINLLSVCATMSVFIIHSGDTSSPNNSLSRIYDNVYAIS